MSTSNASSMEQNLSTDTLPGNMDDDSVSQYPAPSQTQVSLPASFGEVLDRLTILDLKLAHARVKNYTDDRLRHLQAERTRVSMVVRSAATSAGVSDPVLLTWCGQLSQINNQLWDVEDRIRYFIANGSWNDKEAGTGAFVFNALLVPYLNDIRSDLKREINRVVHGDAHTEFKVYSSEV